MNKKYSDDTLITPILLEKLVNEMIKEALATNNAKYYTKAEADAKFAPKSS